MRSTLAAMSNDIAAIGRGGINRTVLDAGGIAPLGFPPAVGPLMRMFRVPAASWAVAIAISALAQAQAAPCDLIGVWKLTYFASENMNTNLWRLPFGESPRGYLAITPERVIAVLVADSRKPPHPDRASAVLTSLAYSGPYWIETDRLTVRVQVAWDETWSGTNQVHALFCEEDKLFLNTVPGFSIYQQDTHGTSRFMLGFVRVE